MNVSDGRLHFPLVWFRIGCDHIVVYLFLLTCFQSTVCLCSGCISSRRVENGTGISRITDENHTNQPTILTVDLTTITKMHTSSERGTTDLIVEYRDTNRSRTVILRGEFEVQLIPHQNTMISR